MTVVIMESGAHRGARNGSQMTPFGLPLQPCTTALFLFLTLKMQFSDMEGRIQSIFTLQLHPVPWSVSGTDTLAGDVPADVALKPASGGRPMLNST